MKTGKEMVEFCKEHYNYVIAKASNLGVAGEDFWIKTFNTMAAVFEVDEEARIAFIGVHNYKSVLKHGDTCAYTITNKRILVAEKKFTKIKIVDESPIEGLKASYEPTAMMGIIQLVLPDKTISVGLNKDIAERIITDIQKLWF